MSVPAPINIPPSGQMLGNDGFWQTFAVQLGSPVQTLQLLPSTLIAETMVVNSNGCSGNSFSNCSLQRGGLFAQGYSNSWSALGNASAQYSLGVDGNLGISSNDGGYWGYDTVGLTAADGNSISLDKMVVAAYSTYDFYVGMFGLSQKHTAFSGATSDSFMKTLFEKNEIPSYGYSYTAGAVYNNSLPSFILGGQDLNAFQPNNVNLTMAPSGDRELALGLQTITLEADGGTVEILDQGIMVGIDTSQPYIWLPKDACDVFAKQFGLTQSEITSRYILNSSQHEANLKLNPTLTFQVGNAVEGGETVNISFPYAAFDLNYTDELTTPAQNSYMFPIREQDDTQSYTLGRAFLQEAYLSVNYQYSNFSISQANTMLKGHQPHIVPLGATNSATTTGQGASPGNNNSSSSSGIGAGAIAGIVVGVVAIAAIAFLVWFCLRRRRKHREQNHPGGLVETSYSASDSRLPPEPELETKHNPPPMSQQQPVDYFAYNKQNAKFHQKPFVAPVLSSDSSQRGELESNNGYSSGMSSPRDALTAYHDTAQELAGAGTTPGPVELPTRNTSVRGSRISEAPSSSSAQPNNGPVTRDATSWADGTHLEEASITSRPSALSANSVTFMHVGSPSLVSHSRAGTSRVHSTGSDVSTVPPLPAPQGVTRDALANNNILDATARAYSTVPQGPTSPTNPILPVIQSAHSDRSGDTLVDSQSPTAVRHPDPDIDDPTSPIEDFVHNSPHQTSLGYRGAWERPPHSTASRDS